MVCFCDNCFRFYFFLKFRFRAINSAFCNSGKNKIKKISPLILKFLFTLKIQDNNFLLFLAQVFGNIYKIWEFSILCVFFFDSVQWKLLLIIWLYDM